MEERGDEKINKRADEQRRKKKGIKNIVILLCNVT